jgi:Fuc2NAc and GlcNAc transferase
MSPWWSLPLVVALAWWLTGAMRRYALSRQLLDIPNTRSSHTTPTPRGGGVAIVTSFLLAVLWLALVGAIGWPLSAALLGAGAGCALLGFLDDHGHIAARWRLLGHFAAAGWVLYWLGGAPPLTLFGHTLAAGWLADALVALYLVWLLNLYNFMDGIDGIAGVEAITVCMGAAAVVGLAPGIGSAADIGLPLLLAGAVAGFLVWNFPPARIFMGDAGSGFLGITLGILSLHAGGTAPPQLWSWLILLGVFVVDATVTLLRRLLRGERVYEAHRSHAYQQAARRYERHLPVTLAVAVINLGWLLPIAACVALGRLDGGWGLVIAYAPVLLLAVRLGAGMPEASCRRAAS